MNIEKKAVNLGAKVFVLVAIGCVTMLIYSRGLGDFQQFQAITMCQSALKKTSPDPEKVSIPLVGNIGNETEFRFSWDATTQMIHVRNQFGDNEAVSASCTVDKPTKRVITLTLGSRSII